MTDSVFIWAKDYPYQRALQDAQSVANAKKQVITVVDAVSRKRIQIVTPR